MSLIIDYLDTVWTNKGARLRIPLQRRHNDRDVKSPASRLFTQPFVQVRIKENSEAPRHWPLWGEFTGDWWIPRKKDQ